MKISIFAYVFKREHKISAYSLVVFANINLRGVSSGEFIAETLALPSVSVAEEQRALGCCLAFVCVVVKAVV